MAHSTGAENRLNRNMHNSFGDKDYAREELVAELTAALSLNVMGLTSTIQDSNVAYLQSWISTLKEQPHFIMTILGDVSKAASMIQETVCSQEVKEKIKENTIRDIGDFIEKRNEENARRIPSVTELESFSIKDAVARRTTGNDNDSTDRLSFETLKKRFPNAILLFRNKKVYEVFNEDAIRCTELLGIIRSNRDFGNERKIPYASFPAEKLDTFLPKLVRAGEKVAICDLPPAELKRDVSTEQGKKLHSAYLGNGISYWEEGDLEYKGHISCDRKVTMHNEFTPENKARIEETARTGNMVVEGMLVLNPINRESKIGTNPATGEEMRYSVENIDGKAYVCSGRTVVSDEPEKYIITHPPM